MHFTITHPMHRHPYNPELVSGDGIAAVAAAAEAAGIQGFGVTDHPAPSQRWLEAGGHDALDPFVAMGYAAADPEPRGAAVSKSFRSGQVWRDVGSAVRRQVHPCRRSRLSQARVRRP